MIARLWLSFLAWAQRNAAQISVASLLLSCFVLSQASADRDAAHKIEAQNCDAARLRFVDVSTFWIKKATTHAAHALHESDASVLWNTIVGDFSGSHNPLLVRHIAAVSATWQHLSDDDTAESQYDASYVDMLRRDYTKSCGDAPTPVPTTTVQIVSSPKPARLKLPFRHI